MAEILRAGAVQLNSTEDREHNLKTAERLVREAATRGATLIVLPEKWPQLGHAEVMEAGAETLEGPVVSWAKALAAELGVELIVGSFVERRAGQERTSNTSVHIGVDGKLKAVYRKLHMFDVEVEGVTYAESAREQAGEETTVTDLAGGHRLGMSICYDVRFPELYRALSERGAEVLAVPAAFTLATTRDHWEVLLRARAIENQCFMIAANQIGEYLPGRRSGGRSMIVDPWGVVLAVASDTECAIVADLDFELLRDVRRRLPALAHRHSPQVYLLPAGSR